ncbi:hypothetical protein BC629DRAFT_1445632, partial [Irpex lacteus]
VAKRKGTKDARVWVWGWKARVRIREFAVGGGESVEVRVFLVPAQQLTSNEDEEASMVVLTRLGGDNARDRACRLQDVSPTSTLTASTLPLSWTDSPSTYLTTLTSSTPSSSTLDTTAAQALRSDEARSWDYDHPGYIGCVGTFVNELETAKRCGNCMARRLGRLRRFMDGDELAELAEGSGVGGDEDREEEERESSAGDLVPFEPKWPDHEGKFIQLHTHHEAPYQSLGAFQKSLLVDIVCTAYIGRVPVATY